MPLTDEEKQRVVALARQWIAPESGMEKHFVRVVQGNGIACTELEKDWLLFWHDYQRTTTPFTSNWTSTKCCADCGSAIPPERLAANPSATRCVACQEKLEQKNPGEFTRRIDEGIGGTREDNKKMRTGVWVDMRNRGR